MSARTHTSSGARVRPRRLLLTCLAAAALLAPVGAAAAEGNNGTLKVHEFGTPSGTESNDPKVCVFNFEGFGFDVGQTGTIQIDGQGETAGSFGPFAFGPTVASDEHFSYAETEYFNDDDGPAIPDGLYKATLYGKTLPDGQADEEKAKSKVFTVDCEPDEEEPTEDVLGEVTVVKVIDADGDLATTGDRTPGEGWSFDYVIVDGEILDETAVTNASGTAGFAFSTEAASAGVGIAEDAVEGWDLLAAACHPVSGEGQLGAAIGTLQGLEITFAAEAGGAYVCFFVNAEEEDDGGEEPTQVTNPTPTPTPTPTPSSAAPSVPDDDVTGATQAPTITMPPTDSTGLRGESQPVSMWPVLLTLGLVAGGATVVTLRRGVRAR